MKNSSNNTTAANTATNQFFVEKFAKWKKNIWAYTYKKKKQLIKLCVTSSRTGFQRSCWQNSNFDFARKFHPLLQLEVHNDWI